MCWVKFTSRTDGRKLAWIRKRLTDRGIRWRNAGHSFHATLLEVDAERIEEAMGMLCALMPEGTSIDDTDDEDERFCLEGVAEDAFPWDLPEEEEE